MNQINEKIQTKRGTFILNPEIRLKKSFTKRDKRKRLRKMGCTVRRVWFRDLYIVKFPVNIFLEECTLGYLIRDEKGRFGSVFGDVFSDNGGRVNITNIRL